MSAQLSGYLHAFREQSYPELFSSLCLSKLSNIERRYGDMACSQAIAEIPMSGRKKTLDFSIAIDTPWDLIPSYWLEMDYKDYANAPDEDMDIPSSIFYDASLVCPGTNNRYVLRSFILPRLLDDEQAEKILPAFENVLRVLSGKCTRLYQVGAMRARGDVKSLRIITWRMKRTDILAFLKEAGWTGDLEQLDLFLRGFVPLVGRFFLDFDLDENGISERIAIEASARNREIALTEKLLAKANEDAYLSTERHGALLRWLHALPQLMPQIQNDISHIKFTFSKGKATSAKAYLRMSGLFLADEAPALSYPWQMNLELSDKCPLHCPQCFVHLNEGRELPLETALFRLRDAKKTGITAVSLSGGESAIYPHLTEVIAECARLGMVSAVSFSGARLTKKLLKGILAAGVNEIFISLNGSTEEINAITRDGYKYAMKALALLEDVDSAETGINWVMHHSNSRDFPNMIALCEKYGLKRLLLLSLKADSSGRLQDYPTKEDFLFVAQTLRNYKGELLIEIESCLSQLRALVFQGHLSNRNTGLLRGCGAGRDKITVTCEGKLVPCRHLNIAEVFPTMKEYWEESEVLRCLRDIYGKPQGKCAHCSYQEHCLPCVEIGYHLHDRIAFGMEECPL